MGIVDFMDVLDNQLARIRDVLDQKRGEYAPDEDKLANFKSGAAMLQTTPEKVLRGYLTKHLVSLFSMIESGEDYHTDVWTEKITDSINYLILLRAMIIEKKMINMTGRSISMQGVPLIVDKSEK